MARNGPRIRVQRLKISRIAHFSQNVLEPFKIAQNSPQNGLFSQKRRPIGKKTENAIEFAVFENPILDSSHADLDKKFFCSKMRVGVSSWFFSIFDHFQKN